MTDKKHEGLTEDELRAAEGEQLPAREVMSIVTTDPQPLPAVDDGSGMDPVDKPEPTPESGGTGGEEPLRGGENL